MGGCQHYSFQYSSHNKFQGSYSDCKAVRHGVLITRFAYYLLHHDQTHFSSPLLSFPVMKFNFLGYYFLDS
jgi:hypothetical protein